MELSAGFAAGFAYAAIASGDTALIEAHAGLGEELARALRPGTPSRADIPGLLPFFVRPLPDVQHVPPRIRAVVAGRLPRLDAERWLVGVGMPRAGYRSTSELRDYLRRLVSAIGHTEAP